VLFFGGSIKCPPVEYGQIQMPLGHLGPNKKREKSLNKIAATKNKVIPKANANLFNCVATYLHKPLKRKLKQKAHLPNICVNNNKQKYCIG